MKHFIFLSVFLVFFLVLTDGLAVQTKYIEHDSEEQLKQGDPNGVLISSSGELTAGYRSGVLLASESDIWVVNALALSDDGGLYAATSGRGRIYRLCSGEPPQIIYGDSDQSQGHIFSLAIDSDGRLLAAVSGHACELLRFDQDGTFETILTDDRIDYIWSILTAPDGRIYLGTGPNGLVFELDSSGGGDSRVIYDAKEKNILSLAIDSSGFVYAGGDEYGLVYRIDPAEGRARIVYDTERSEISALLFDDLGNLYISTAEAGAARPGADLIFSNGDNGRSEPSSEKAGQNDNGEDVVPPQAEPAADSPAEGSAEESSSVTESKKLRPAQTDPMADESTPVGTDSEPKRPIVPDLSARGKSPRSPARTNEVFRVSPGGYVRRLFSQSVMILDMSLRPDGELLLATGNEGHLLLLDTDTAEALVLHTADPSAQISSLVCGLDGTIYAGCANPGSVISIEPFRTDSGEYISSVIDAGQVSRWGNLQIDSDIPAGASLSISTRSGNTADPDKGGWDDWTAPTEATLGELPIGSSASRFLRYRLLFGIADGDLSPIVRAVKLAHQSPNLPPEISSLKLDRSKPSSSSLPVQQGGKVSKTWDINWQADDANGDRLSYDIFIRPLANTGWIRLKEDLTDTSWQWDSRTVADGRYELKLSACDRLDNPEGTELTDTRLSRPVVVDNTAPQVDLLNYEQSAGGPVRVIVELSDLDSVIGSVLYCIDSAEDWRSALPTDGIFDSRSERVEFEFSAASGEHLLSVRIADALGNELYRNITVLVAE